MQDIAGDDAGEEDRARRVLRQWRELPLIPFSFRPRAWTLLALAALSMCALVLLVEKTKMGRAMRAVAENPRVAGLMGVDSNRVIVYTFAIGAALAAVAGVMWGANYASIQFAMGTIPGLKAFCAAVLGGIGISMAR